MKDIYSPLEIDEEWDQRAPDMGSNEGGGTTVAVAPESGVANSADMSSEVGTSTLPPEQAADVPNDTNSAPMAGDTVEPAGDMAHDPAHDAAEAVVAQPTTGEASEATPVPADTLDINEMNSTPEPDGITDQETADTSMDAGSIDATQPENTEGDAVATTEEQEPMKVNVMGDTEVDEPNNKVEAGETFNPETFPGGKMPEPETVEPEEEDKEPELPASPVAEEEKSEPEPKEEVEAEEPTEMDSTDKRFMAAIEEWNKAKERANERLTKLKADVEADIDRTRAEIAELEEHVDTKEKEREEIQSQLDELGDVKSAA